MRRPASGLMAVLLVLPAILWSCGEGGEIVGQRTFLWHSGDAVGASLTLPMDVANPFRGRVAPVMPRVGSFAPGFAVTFGDGPDALRYFTGDPSIPPLFTGRVDPLDPRLDRILNAPATVRAGLVPAGYMDISDFIDSGIALSSFFPSDFGGDFGATFCIDPRSQPDADLILQGLTAPPAGRDCIRGSVDTATGLIYTQPSIIAMRGGAGEAPFRPAPDRASALDPASNGGTRAQGLYFPTRGLLQSAPMRFERNVDPATGRPLVARIGGGGIGTCGSHSAGPPSSFLVPSSSAVSEWSTGYASHPLSVTTGVSFPTLVILDRGGIGTDPDCLRPGGPPGEPNALADFLDGIDDDLLNTNALYAHHANQGMFASLCAATLNGDTAIPLDGCLFSWFNTSSVVLPQLFQLPMSELLAVVLAGEQSGLGSPSAMSLIVQNQKFAEADVTPPTISLNRLFNDPSAPIIDRNGDGGFGDGPSDASDCASSDPVIRWGCDLRGFDGFDGRVALITQIAGALRPDGSQWAFQTLDNSLTNEQRGLGGCGPFYGVRCDSSANVNPLPPIPGDVNRRPTRFAAAGGLDLLNGEASALLESVRDPSDPEPTTSAADQPGTPGFVSGGLCMRRLAGGQLVRLPGCRGVKSYSITMAGGVPAAINVEFDAGYLPSEDGCIIGSRVFDADQQVFVPVIPTGGNTAELVLELPLCNGAVRTRAVPKFQLAGYGAGEPILAANVAATGTCGGALLGAGEPGTPARGTPGVIGTGDLDLRWCDSDLVTLEMAPLIHPLAGCEDSDVWFDARADNVAPDTGLPYGGCEFFYERDLVQEFFDGTAQLFRTEFAAVSWNLISFLASTSCDEKTSDPNGMDHRQPPAGMGFPLGAIGGLRADPQCFDAERPFTPGRCSFATPQLCKNVVALLGVAPRIKASGGVGDDDVDGVAEDGDASGVVGDRPCLTGQVLGCDDNCADLTNTGQVNSNGVSGGATDGFGNLCDPDLDNDGDIDLQDRALQDECFLTGTSTSIDCADADLVGSSLDVDADPIDPAVNGFDRLQLLRWLRDPMSAPGAQPD